MVLSVIPFFSSGDWHPSKELRVAMIAKKNARLATQHAISIGHHECCFRDRHVELSDILMAASWVSLEAASLFLDSVLLSSVQGLS